MITLPVLNGTLATEEIMHVNFAEDMTITATSYVDICDSTSQLLTALKNDSKKLNMEQIKVIEERLQCFSNKTEEYYECMFLIKALKKGCQNYPVEFSESNLNGGINDSDENQVDSVETYLIDKRYKSYINLGDSGRKLVARRMSTLDFNNEDRLEDLLNNEIRALNEKIIELKNAGNADDFYQVGYALGFDWASSGDEILLKAYKIWTESNKEDLKTLTHVYSRLEEVINKVNEDGFSSPTISENLYSRVN
ncbi:hypothetical protein IMZ31_17315 [Pontibacillus sp. ALD_SL1]|uniref:hypothetical protein n=1 Tax=Pontibacillus sp. ALD_SL1 TaxID=2777185 RepID=UPI001A96329E|nr:hypothetical protein [Pontibacillus sp. ALD_SL1]QSS99799.1 hypothetical protein IMZ31_17315 [Pontibacillus sp. ALD_SL1]